MADEGYYRSDGIQNSGTALTVNNQNVYIFTGTGFMQIYPREISQTISNSNFGGFTTSTYRSTGDWRDCAYQGVKSVGYNKNRLRICYGHIVPSSIPRYNNLIAVDYVRIGFQPHRCGWSSISRDLVFRVGLNGNNIPPMEGEYRFSLGARQDRNYQRAEGGAGSSLANLMYILINRGNRLILYNGETTLASPVYDDGSGYGSRDYAAIETFTIEELRLRYQP